MVTQIYKQQTQYGMLKNVKYDFIYKYLLFDNSSLTEKSLNYILLTLFNIKENLFGVSFS